MVIIQYKMSMKINLAGFSPICHLTISNQDKILDTENDFCPARQCQMILFDIFVSFISILLHHNAAEEMLQHDVMIFLALLIIDCIA